MNVLWRHIILKGAEGTGAEGRQDWEGLGWGHSSGHWGDEARIPTSAFLLPLLGPHFRAVPSEALRPAWHFFEVSTLSSCRLPPGLAQSYPWAPF